ncbi:plasmid pRiA4b ORF-3 family protein [Alloyangia pacifica]|uniref:plasmid pRiA4b ORF-3 family protein n=1 Tax=Alloyangia pacifica TaxID=311180 RepID=UPI001CFDA7C7|nr:plasmid pRiA4b ORF-3 family protein [Alloyangia pacifica]
MGQERNAVRLLVTLEDIDPPIWRRLVLPSTWTLDRLHLVLQAAFSWTDSHLHEFHIGGLRYGNPEILDIGFGNATTFDYRTVRMADFIDRDIAFTYVYDFGDNWRHRVVLEDILVLDPLPRHAECLEGARAGPPDDVGGPWSYPEFIETLQDAEHQDHASNLRWAGGHFDPEWFDLALINKDIRNTFRANVRRRWHQPKPLIGKSSKRGD